MAGGAELGGAHGFDDSEPPWKKEMHWAEEELTPSSPKHLSKAKDASMELAVAARRTLLGEIPKRKKTAARARFGNLDAKRSSLRC